jgi:hypothetical protein
MVDPVHADTAREALAAARSYADSIVIGPLTELSGILTDTIGYWRLRNQVRLMLKAKQWLQAKGVEPTKLLPDVFVPLLQCGGEKEDEALAEMFASLLASHLDPKSQEKVHPSFPRVLSELSSLDAKTLTAFRSLASDRVARISGLPGPGMPTAMVANHLHVTQHVAYLSCLNLARLGLVSLLGPRPPEKHPLPGFLDSSPGHQEFRISEYGIAFCDACRYMNEEP